MGKRLITLNLTEDEIRVLEDLAERKGLSKTAVLRHALRLYQAVNARIQKGDKFVFENEATKEKAELVVL